MADRSSAYIFGTVFRMLASEPTPKHLLWARKLWKESLNYDFSPYQMESDAALKKLGLARTGLDPEYPEDGPTTLYGPKR